MNVRDVVPRDAIPSIDEPAFAETYDGDPDDEAIVIDFEGAPARAYPLGILHYHEIVNDEVAGRPIAVTWCPLCASAVVYDRTVDGRALEFGVSESDTSGGSKDSLVLSFGVSGKLADDDLVLYDRETDSEWKQSLGECIAGEFEGRALTVLPASVTTVERFRRDHRGGGVLVPPGGRSEASGDGPEMAPIEYDAAPYERYFAGDGFGLAAHRGDGSREWGRDDLAPKEIVLGIERDGTALGVPRSRVVGADADRENARGPEDEATDDATTESGVVTVTIGDLPIVVFATPDGMAAFESPGYAFTSTDDPHAFDGDGTRWNGATGESTDGRNLARVPTRRLFAFAWQDDHGPEAFYGE
ncbi:DUF3179 domain-containing (seleno)protein [Halococcus agarilyticus]|uniref:DUF3179 domain-containing (seleno)protein n=1 Tax=Halococcus agarilyticus TaxID=1232219 RepID=UPI000677ABA0|nr:DUF3179 domain-containing (seleno)protein [Halococcus agarilyticus]